MSSLAITINLQELTHLKKCRSFLCKEAHAVCISKYLSLVYETHQERN